MHVDQKSDSAKPRQYTLIILVAIAVLAIGTSIFFYVKYQRSQSTAQAQQKKIVTNISKAIELPGGSPTVVTVADKAKLSNKALAERVENKDMLLIYGESKRIIIYRPSTKKVVDMLSFASTAENPTSGTSTTKEDSQLKS